MKADFSRLRLAAAKHEVAWLQQQGRVWLDSDWNEDALTRLALLELEVRDLVGQLGVPEPGTGFAITAAPGGELAIGGGSGAGGHLYVEGIVCVNERPTTYTTQPDLPDPPALNLPATGFTGWQVTGDLLASRSEHAAVLLTDGRVLVIGGFSEGAPTATAELYDPSAGTWTAASSMRIARVGHRATLLYDGRVLVTGGRTSGGIVLASAEIYDPVTGAWSAVAPMQNGRSYHSATRLYGGQVLVAGGAGPQAGSPTSLPSGAWLSSAELYDPGANTWSAAGAMQAARAYHTATLMVAAGGPVLVAGGRGDGAAVSSAERYDPDSNAWSRDATLLDSRERHAATLLPDGQILVSGGEGLLGPLASAELYDSRRGQWRRAASMSSARVDHSASLLVDGRILAAGGYDSSADLFDSSANQWTATARLNEARGLHSGTTLPDGRVLVAGGSPPAASGEMPSAEIYTPTASTFGIAYLDVWRRLVTYLQDDTREIALGGPDTTVRLRTMAQVRVADVPFFEQPGGLDCAAAAAYLPPRGGGRLSTLIDPPATTPDPCQLPEEGIYTGLENRLYRVEIYHGGKLLDSAAPQTLTLAEDAEVGSTELTIDHPLSADESAALRSGRWTIRDQTGSALRAEPLLVADAAAGSSSVDLELPLRATYAVAGRARVTHETGSLALTAAADAGAQVLMVSPDRTAEFATAANGEFAGRSWFVRGAGNAEPIVVTNVDSAGGAISLAEPLTSNYPAGSEVTPQGRFTWSASNAAFAVAVLNVEDFDLHAPTMTLQLASLGRDATTVLSKGDLVEIIGDRAELGPGRGLVCRIAADPDPDALTVLVDAADPRLDPSVTGLAERMAEDHVVLRRWDGIEFARADPDGVDLGDGVRVSVTGSDFRAGDYWWFITRAADGSVQPLSEAAPNGIARHRAPLALLQWTGDTEGVSLAKNVPCVAPFDSLTDLQARHVSFDDQTCRLGATTVQEALDQLCAKLELTPWPVVAAGGISWRNDRPLDLGELNAGLRVTFSEPMQPATASPETFRVAIEAPVASRGRASIELTGMVHTQGRSWTFVPEPQIDAKTLQDWVQQEKSLSGSANVRVRVCLKGNAILDARGRPLDGDVFGQLRREGYEMFTDLQLPSGDAVRGGDFESWFFLTPPSPPARVVFVQPRAGAVISAPPAAVTVAFSKEVRRSSLTPASVSASVAKTTIPAEVQPYPFDTGVELVARATLVFDRARTPAIWERVLAAAGSQGAVVTVRVRGTGEAPVIDADGLALDGAGNGGDPPTDFTASFVVGRPT